MILSCFRVENFRRLKDVLINLENDKTIFVGANNSGKTSATHVLQLFLGENRGKFRIYDFTADSWDNFNAIGEGTKLLEWPSIRLDLWFDVDLENVHRVVDILPSLAWKDSPVGVRVEFVPRDPEQTLARFKRAKEEATPPADAKTGDYVPWPMNMQDYLKRELLHEYELRYYVLDRNACDDNFKPLSGAATRLLGTVSSGAASIVESIIRVDFLDAQRHLSDADGRGRTENLSKRLSRFYKRNLEKTDQDFEALEVVANSERKLNDHFANVFRPTLDQLRELGYPGLDNPGLAIKASLDAHSILSGNAEVHYALSTPGDPGASVSAPTLPDQYNGLGFKNLIFMVVEVLDFHQAWLGVETDRPPVHLIVIEEPEAHLHAQLQQVFINKILSIIPDVAGFHSQMLVTTHSPHIIYESSFKPVRYFSRSLTSNGVRCTDVRDLSIFYNKSPEDTRDFLQQYFKLTHCDLFFADGVVLVEGNVERLLLPLFIEKSAPQLKSCHLTILEVGGAFAHKFAQLIDFLDVTTLVITDLDSVVVLPPASDDSDEPAEQGERAVAKPKKPKKAKTYLADIDGAQTSNQTLRSWIPKLETIADLLGATDNQLCPPSDDGSHGRVRIAYQSTVDVTWQSAPTARTGRTLEEAFALENLAWTQEGHQKALGLGISNSNEMSIDDLHLKIHERVASNFDKTGFALNLMSTNVDEWRTPAYIVSGLTWFSDQLVPTAVEVEKTEREAGDEQN